MHRIEHLVRYTWRRVREVRWVGRGAEILLIGQERRDDRPTAHPKGTIVVFPFAALGIAKPECPAASFGSVRSRPYSCFIPVLHTVHVSRKLGGTKKQIEMARGYDLTRGQGRLCA